MSFSQGTRGWPVATIAFVQTQATKAAVGIVTIENAEPTEMRGREVDQGDIRPDTCCSYCAALGTAVWETTLCCECVEPSLSQ